jgi:outer membrane lipoprotein-sorting protein
MRRVLPVICAVLAAVMLGGAGQPAPRRLHPAYSDEEKSELDRVSAAPNAIHTLKSGFLQIGPDGQVVQGDLYLEKPGKIRFAYRPPSPVLIVATGGTVYVKNARLNTLDHYDLSDTPLGLLLNEKVDLKTNQAVVGVDSRDGTIVVNARTSTNRNNSNISLVFDAPSLELRQWTVKDNQGGSTTVALQQPEKDVALDDSLFDVPQKAPATRVKQSRN